MTNPHPTDPTGIDIAASAGRVTRLIRSGHVEEGLRLHEQISQTERPVVKEAMDRYVAAEALQHVWERALRGELDPELGPTLSRLQQALGPPRMPDYSHAPREPNELAGLTEAQMHDIYASIVHTRGNDAARQDLQPGGQSVMLGLRRETSTLASREGGREGTGVYDDQMIVLSQTAEGEKRIFITARASTEPTAQYSHQAGSNGDRDFAGGGKERRNIAPAAGYEEVRPRAINGEDVNGDTLRDLGRLAEGTNEMAIAEHRNPASAGTRQAFRPSPEQLTADRQAGRVQRDTNGDGYFNDADVNGVQDLNESFKIHSGSRSNTDSAGCQTIHPEDYQGFIRAATDNPQQTRWQYVLTSTHDGPAREAVVVGNAAADGAETREPREHGGNPQAPVPAVPAPHGHRPETRHPERAGQRGDRPGPMPASPRPFNDEGLNRYYAALMGGDAALADRIALGFVSRFPDFGLQRPDEARAKVDEGPAQQREEAVHAHLPGLQA